MIRKASEKKLKPVKSHYAHETRKDVDLASLSSLKLDAAWPLIRAEIEREIANDELVCVPYLNETAMYRVASAFDEGGRPLGRVRDLIDRRASDAEYAKWLDEDRYEDGGFAFPHESVKITLQDEVSKNKVRVIMMNLFRLNFPKDKSPENKIYLNMNKEELKNLETIYIITDVLMAKTVEFRANHGIASRIFHIGQATPLVFTYEQFKVEKDGKLSLKLTSEKKNNKIPWSRVDNSDRLYTKPEEMGPTMSVEN